MNLYLKKSNLFKFKLNNIQSFYTHSQTKIGELFTKIHGHYRHDGYNKIKVNKSDFDSIVQREQKIFKYWKDYLSVYYKDWEKRVLYFIY